MIQVYYIKILIKNFFNNFFFKKNFYKKLIINRKLIKT